MSRGGSFDDANLGLVEDLYRQYLEDPDSLSQRWRDFFSDERPSLVGNKNAERAEATRKSPLLEGDETRPLRGAAARIVENMEASLGVPTATSVREVPAKLLEVNRVILNNHLGRHGGGKVSFTHLIAFAVLRAIERVPNMNAGYVVADDGTPTHVRHEHVNLGLAVDLEKSDGTRTLLVPNIKHADTLDFAELHAAYEELIRRVRQGKIEPDDFAGTTVSITNPGMIGTVHSIPRLMPGQGLIVGVGALTYPAAYEGADPSVLARLGMSKTITLTSTYDHRVIQGAESGEFLRQVHGLLLGEDGFYDDCFRAVGVPYEPARWKPDVNPLDETEGRVEKQTHVNRLVNMYRVRGHLIADLDPLGAQEPKTHDELDPNFWGLTIWDLDREFFTDGIIGKPRMTLREILGVMRDAYARTVGIEYMHIQEPDQKDWIQERVEGVRVELTPDDKRRILERLNAAEAFERFLNTKYLGHKRFGIEGGESLIPMLDALLSEAADEGFEDAVVGMAHRGRLNILANILGKSHAQIFREFEGDLDPSTTQGSGDVKYHVGAMGKHASPSGNEVTITLASNPSHLEAVDPVVEGMTRALQDQKGHVLERAGDHDAGRGRVLSVLIHGDAAFAGQGVVAETFNLSALAGYEVGGTVHIVVNNQVGFTASPEAARSSVYATDVAKMVQAPIFHVNGDDPEACVRVIRLALAFRQAFHKDVVVDMWCYRQFGHNEADEPSYTQPLMYQRIEQKRSVRKLYTEVLVNRGDLTVDEAEAALADFQQRLDDAFEQTHQSSPTPVDRARRITADLGVDVETGVERETLDGIARAVTSWPDGFRVHPKLEKQLVASFGDYSERGEVSWALAEQLAFGSLLLEGVPIRVAGQDSRRGTFSHRHAVLVDYENEREWCPLSNLDPGQAPFMIYDSLLSEYAAMGFEYGYSVAHPDALVCWEAQFGDFANGAQIIIDQFVAAAEDKWGQCSAFTLLLPHGFEGQGPEHSSARMERFLVLCAEDNMRVVQPTTAAQYFHALRRQVHAAVPKPLVVFTPKRYLRMPSSRSGVDHLASGRFLRVLDDPEVDDPDGVKRVLLCSGKIGHELIAARNERGVPAAVLRLEQLYPLGRDELAEAMGRYRNATDVIWVQDEPENMGPWPTTQARLRELLPEGLPLSHATRAESGSPAAGSATIHDAQATALLDTAFAGL
ncbi:MAG: multifunctional oxoglutarate decarboxylase/oxoglutarate dehydrogenase thiamine pyrophosphate-binding subunit/dihydrolipoyllysine-residue succinyltransferase subunit [Actinobacteria bacterium]|nr:multifunctional oxoglutarate decarboxylase/oxoglutarate dehydrogenase thiamine pyrophosphate-binding subunit/dihydrolipoyllysine-residue succinyltransferase subunit [Actinomycetota bacterium]